MLMKCTHKSFFKIFPIVNNTTDYENSNGHYYIINTNDPSIQIFQFNFIQLFHSLNLLNIKEN